ncbi:hypothetical protein CHU98_g9251 [Xylaria longipes]|nr:hypothetical protein CHU98_g9251 [Xylaria longipes]
MAPPGSSPSLSPSQQLQPINGTTAVRFPEVTPTTNPPNEGEPNPAKDGDDPVKKPDDQNQGKGQKLKEENKVQRGKSKGSKWFIVF